MTKKSKHPTVVLGSQSPRRRWLLRQIGFRFRTKPSRVGETIREDESPEQNARRIALEKAFDVARRTRSGIVVGADTIVVLGRRILGKPRSDREARHMLALLSGKTHTVVTGFALVDAKTQRAVVRHETTRVTFRHLTKREILDYVASGSPMDKAGAYGIQDDFGAVFVEKVDGCYYNVVGFPLARFYTTWQEFTKRLNHH